MRTFSSRRAALAALLAAAVLTAIPAAAAAVPTGSAWRFQSTSLSPPRLTVSHRSAAASGLIFTAPFKNFAIASPVVGQPGALIVRGDGTPVWFRAAPAGQTIADFQTQSYRGRPVLSFWQGVVELPGNAAGIPAGSPGPGAAYHVLDQHYRPLRTITGRDGWTADLHEFTITPQGTAIFVVAKRVAADLTPYGGATNGQYEDNGIQEVDLNTGRLLFQWDMAQHIPLSQAFDRPPPKGTWDPFHINSIELGPNGDLLISARETWSLYDIAHDGAGAVTWTLDAKPAATDSSFQLGPGAAFSWQHDARFLADGSVSLFDDHCCNLAAPAAGPPPAARGLVLRLDRTAGTASVAASYTHSPGLVVATQGNMQSLPGGNRLIGWGQAPVISEYNGAGQLVYELELPAADESYRSLRLPWTGLPAARPAVAVRRHGARATVYASWNGATGVARWQLQAGDARHLRVVRSVRARGFETAIGFAPGARKRLRVRALDARGHVVGASRTVASTPPRRPAHAAATTLLQTRQAGGFGPVLAAANGHVLYEFDRDSRTRSRCTGACTRTWKPLAAVGSVRVKSGSGLQQRLVGHVRRPGGALQVSYNGHPLYLYTRDRRAGQLGGQAASQFGGDWYVLGPKGRPIACQPGLACGY